MSADRYTEARQRLESLRELKVGWDSYGALPIEPEAIRRAAKLLDTLEAAGYPVPHVCGGKCAGVVFDWNDDWQIEVESVSVDMVG